MSRSRNWMFTLYGEDFKEETKLELAEPSACSYGVWQLERCPSTGRLHFQGYLHFANPRRLDSVRSVIGGSPHCEVRKGSHKQAMEYCSKVETRVAGPWTIGSEPEQGKRSDLDNCASAIKGGMSISEVRKEFPVQYIRYRRGIEALCHNEQREWSRNFRDVEVVVYYGRAGAGKTKKAVEESGNDYFILDQGERVWFDGYEGEKILIIDDFYGWIKYGMLLRILDGYQYRCEIKGGFTYALWNKVYITSNKHPREWYTQGMTPALERRITNIINFE